MKSRTSCFNGALLRRDLSRSALLWGAYTLIWFLILPLGFFTLSYDPNPYDLANTVLDITAGAVHVSGLLYGGVTAWFLFSYLYRSRSAHFFGALPQRRECQFLTHYLAGLILVLVPNALIAILTVLAGLTQGQMIWKEAAIWFGASFLTYVFYFSLAVLTAVSVGHIVAMPILYGILNVVFAVVEVLARELIEALTYGLVLSTYLVTGPLSPIVNVYFLGSGPTVLYNWDEVLGVQTAPAFVGWNSLLVLAAAGLILAVAACLLYRKRPMEAAGDAIAFPWMRPIFQWCFTIGAALFFGYFLSELFVPQMDSAYILPISCCILAGAILGFFLSAMILQKSLRVFGGKNWGKCALLCVVMAAGILCCNFGLFGREAYIPDAEEIQSVSLDYSGGTEDREAIDAALALHQEFLEHKQEIQGAARRDEDTFRAQIRYTLTDGRQVERAYRIPCQKPDGSQPELMEHFDAVYNLPRMVLARQLPEHLEERTIYNTTVHVIRIEPWETVESVELTPTEAGTLLTGPMTRDILEGNMGKIYHYYGPTAETTEPAGQEYRLEVEYDISSYKGDYNTYFTYTIPETAAHTRQALLDLGVDPQYFK